MPNLECPHFVESESSTWAVKFNRIWSLEFREIQLTEFSSILVGGFAQNAKGAVNQCKAKAHECITMRIQLFLERLSYKR